MKRFTALATSSWLRKERSLRFKIFLAILCGTLICLLVSAVIADGLSHWRIHEYFNDWRGHPGTGEGGSEIDDGPSYVDTAIFFAGFIGLLLALFLSYWLASRLSRPLAELTSAVHGISWGELGKEVELGTTTEIAELAEAFNMLSANLRRNEELRRNMVADIAHELRTPLTTLRAQIEALEDGVIQPDHAAIASLMEDALLLSRLVEDLQQLALADAGQLELDLDEVDAAELVRQVATRFEPELAQKSVKLGVEAPAGLPAIRADQARVAQVLNNLVGNALTHATEGGSVVIGARVEGREMVFSVADNGPGIAEEDLPFIFERFYRTDRSRARATGGAGLGLSIAKRLVEAHGGTIRAESIKGDGTTVFFTIPLAETLKP